MFKRMFGQGSGGGGGDHKAPPPPNPKSAARTVDAIQKLGEVLPSFSKDRNSSLGHRVPCLPVHGPGCGKERHHSWCTVHSQTFH